MRIPMVGYLIAATVASAACHTLKAVTLEDCEDDPDRPECQQ